MAMRADGMGRVSSASKSKSASKPKSTGQVTGSYSMEGSPSVVSSSGGGRKTQTSRNPTYSAPRVTPAPRSSGGGGSYGGGQVYGGNTLAPLSTGVMAETIPAEPPKPLGFDQFKADGKNYNKDAAYMSETASAESDYKNLIDQLTRQNTDYRTNLASNLRNMGLDFTGEDFGAGQWDPTDRLGAYGQAYGNLENDYSGRGMLDSSFYGQAQNDLTDRFNRQRTSLLDALGQENASFAANKTAAGDARTQAMNRALSEAYTRYVAGFGV